MEMTPENLQELKLAKAREKKELKALKVAKEINSELKRQIQELKREIAAEKRLSFDYPKFLKWFQFVVCVEILYDLIGIALVAYVYIKVYSNSTEEPEDEDEEQEHEYWHGPPWYVTCLGFRLANATTSLAPFYLGQQDGSTFGFNFMALGKGYVLLSVLVMYFFGRGFGYEWETEAWRNSIIFGMIGQLTSVILTAIFIAATTTYNKNTL